MRRTSGLLAASAALSLVIHALFPRLLARGITAPLSRAEMMTSECGC